MAKNPKTPKTDTVVDNAAAEGQPKGEVKHNPPIPTDKELIEKTKADLKAKADAEKAEKAKAKEAAKAEKDKIAAAKKEERAAAKAEREARMAELAAGKNYTGSMLALAERVKSGAYVKGSNGQLRTTDELAVALDGIGATDVVRIGLDLLKLEDNPYIKLNIGQQSMNLRNRMRGAIKKNTLKISDITEYVTRNKIHVVTKADIEATAKAKADKKAAADAEKAEKAAAKAKADAAKPAIAATGADNGAA